ncbi:MAG: sigma-70 family RNA polymerase sigma factor [Sinobacteraceae bacterium]|nr:sigma-70 family RNA polymerase sigma factor [Nevskiaceae bacterium]MBV9913334.1 sigma-70 family RNA polymerase sigma factor [Nevskiaceae bacterium]
MTTPDWQGLLEGSGTASAAGKERLFSTLYAELHHLAERQLKRSANPMVSPTTLLHESYLRFSAGAGQFPDKQRFIGYAARVMRGLLIDLLRERRALKRGAAFHITQLNTEISESHGELEQVTRLSEALDELAHKDPRLAELVDLKYFCGYTFEEIAALWGVSARTLQREWEKARMILFEQLSDAP